MSALSSVGALDAAVAAAFVLLAATGLRHRHRPGAASATLLWTALAAISGALALGRFDVLAGRTAVYAVLAGWFVAVPLWVAFAFAHTARGPSVNSHWVAVAVVYVAAAGATTLWAGELDGALGQLVRVGASILQTGLIGVGLFGVFLPVHSAVTYDDLPNAQAVALAVAGVGVSLLLFSVSTLATFDPDALPVVISGFLAVTAGGFSTGVYRYRLFSDTPGTGPLARRSVLDSMSDSVLVVDREGRLVDANAAAERTLGVTITRDAGRPTEPVLGYDIGGLTEGTATLPTPDGRRRFDVSRSELTNARGDVVGASYLLQDVTDERTRSQRLEVFNRVLRHNLRNDLDAIRGFAEVLAADDQPAPADAARRIHTTANELVDIGETVARADRVVTADSLDARQVDIDDLVADVAADVRERYDCRIAIDVPPAARSLRTDRDVLRTALLEIVENAVEHSDSETPTAAVDAAATADGVRLAVRDDGPGIPDRERAVLLEGEETPLQHGTGVGLWFVSWAVTRLGGDLSFDETESGSEVALHVPD